MFLWRPSQNNQRYAFTPLLDNSEDENEQDVEEDELFTRSGGQRPALFDPIQKRREKTGIVEANGVRADGNVLEGNDRLAVSLSTFDFEEGMENAM